MTASRVGRRRIFAPEVIQTSTMDCGPASLRCLLGGFGIDVGYGRLREACQTDVDGTSIDVLEDVAVQLGLDAEQVMVPADHLLLPEAEALPALVIIQRPHAPVHFVVVWRRHGRFLQVMDPGVGRRWVDGDALLAELYVHRTLLAAADWHAWARSDLFLGPLARRLGELGVSRGWRARLVDRACATDSWHGLGALDAAVRMLATVMKAGGLSRGAACARLLDRIAAPEAAESLPERFWSARPGASDDGEERLLVKGAVLLTVRGPRGARESLGEADGRAPLAPLSPEVRAALATPTRPPLREIVRLLRADGLLQPAALCGAAIVSAGGVAVQALLFRGLLEVGHSLGIAPQRLGAMGAVVAFTLALSLVTISMSSGVLAMGRALEVRLRVAFQSKIPRIADRYFHSRLTSDMADRSHALPALRTLPAMVHGLIHTAFQLVFTIAGLTWLEPSAALPAVAVAVVAVAMGLVSRSWLSERDLAARSHAGALSRFTLDALQGLTCIRAHGAEPALQREQEAMLVHWTHSQHRLLGAAIAVEALQAVATLGLTVWLVFGHLARSAESGSVLLLAYWALQLPSLGQSLAALARQIPAHRNVTARLLEPLSAPEEMAATLPAESAVVAPEETHPESVRRLGVSVRLRGVSVNAGGHTLLHALDLDLAPSSHVAVVGASGAGKSTLVGLLLGWHRAATGSVDVDGEPLAEARLARLRRETAWVDPAVTLFNRRLADNLTYGADGGGPSDVGWIIDAAGLRELVERLPDGLQTSLGEGGALVSGGEAQRVRLGRAMARHDARLVILDEPFRGLDRTRRRELLAGSRELWANATLLCVTHDVGETQSFPRVLVVEDGRIVEDGDPNFLRSLPGSRYAAMLESERQVREGLWSGAMWQRLRVERGRLVDASRVRSLPGRAGALLAARGGDDR